MADGGGFGFEMFGSCQSHSPAFRLTLTGAIKFADIVTIVSGFGWSESRRAE